MQANFELMVQGLVDHFERMEPYDHQVMVMTVKSMSDKYYGPTEDGKRFRETAIAQIRAARKIKE